MPGRSGVNAPGKFFVPTGTVNPDYIRLTQQYINVVYSGDPDTQFIRVSQQYLEVIYTWGTPPIHGKKDDPPGKQKKNKDDINRSYRRMQNRDEARKMRRFATNSIAGLFGNPSTYIAYQERLKVRKITRRISLSPSGHTVLEKEL